MYIPATNKRKALQLSTCDAEFCTIGNPTRKYCHPLSIFVQKKNDLNAYRYESFLSQRLWKYVDVTIFSKNEQSQTTEKRRT